MSGSKKADSRYARLAKAHFQFSDGDVLLECPSAAKEEEEDEENVDVDVDVDVQRPDENAEPTRFVLQVHRSTLAANSTFFKTKFDKAGSKSRGDGKALQKVIMDEDLSIVLVLLGAMYNVPEAQSLLTDSKDWRLLLDVLMAADKYGFKLLRSFASSLLTFVWVKSGNLRNCKCSISLKLL